jgi:hypothetical protein
LVKIDKTTAGIESETKEVVQILKKDSTRGIKLIFIQCKILNNYFILFTGLWVIIILLLIANVVVALS